MVATNRLVPGAAAVRIYQPVPCKCGRIISPHSVKIHLGDVDLVCLDCGAPFVEIRLEGCGDED
jgi:hypothetical protein